MTPPSALAGSASPRAPLTQAALIPLILLALTGCNRGDKAPAAREEVVDPEPAAALEEVDAEETEEPTEGAIRMGPVSISPDTIRVGLRPRANVEAIEGVEFRYEWYVNGVSAGLQDDPVYDGPFARGDELQVEVTPYRDGLSGDPRSSLEKTVANSAPRYLGAEGKGFTLDRHQVRVEDPDGDALTYSLEGAPEGLTSDAHSGLMRFDYTPTHEGKEKTYAVTVRVEDGEGGKVEIAFPVTLREG